MTKEKRKISASVILAFGVLAILIIIMCFAQVICRHDPTEINLTMKCQKACLEYPFGTDDYGRCIFCRCLYATRTSVGIAFTIELISVLIGMGLGMTTAYHGGIPDQIFAAVANGLMAFPNTILIMLIAAFLGASTRNIILAMLLVDWIWYSKIARGLTLTLRERKYVQAARLNGASSATILIRYIAPEILPQLLGQFTLALGNVVLGLAGFSFLGIGIQRPTPELGIMISDGCGLIRTNLSVLLWPGLFLFIIVLDFNILGECLEQRIREKGQGEAFHAGTVED